MEKNKEWHSAQIAEREHWHRLILGLLKGPPNYGGERFWLDLWASQAEFLLEVLRKEFGIIPNDALRVLEIGGGAIGVIRWFERGHLFALDALGDLFKQAFPSLPLSNYPLRKDVTYYAIPAEQMMSVYPLRPFDTVLIFDCLDHCRDPQRVLRNIYGVLKPGRLLCETTTTFYQKMMTSPEYAKYHPWTWEQQDLMEMVSSVGFELAFISDEFPVHPGFKTIGANSDQILRLWRRGGTR